MNKTKLTKEVKICLNCKYLYIDYRQDKYCIRTQYLDLVTGLKEYPLALDERQSMAELSCGKDAKYFVSKK